MSQDINVHTRTRSAGQSIFVLAALAASLFLITQIPNQTVWVEDAQLAAQPRFWPTVALCVMVAGFGIHLFLMRRRHPARSDWGELRRWAPPMEFVAWFMIFVFAVPIIGFLPMSLVFACGLSWRLGYRSRGMQTIAAVFAIGVVIVFKAFLGVRIPGAEIYQYLPDALRSFFLQYL